MRYKLANNFDGILMIEEGGAVICSIPSDPANRHWQEYQAWLALGNEPDPAE